MLDYLRRAEAGLGSPVWEAIDRAVMQVARAQLVGRRLLDLDGPHGIGLKVLTRRPEETVGDAEDGRAAFTVSGALAVPLLYRDFRLGVRDLDAAAEFGQPLDVTPALRAAAAVATLEDQLIFYGDDRAGWQGLVNVPGVQASDVREDWAHGERAIEDIIRAVGVLDRQGPRGDHALALATDLYHDLFHKYSDSDLLRIEHLRTLIAGGIHKSHTLEPRTGVLLVSRPDVARLVVGADLAVAWRRLDGPFHLFTVLESLAVEVTRPEGICVLRSGKGA